MVVDPAQFGPFANVVGLACALVATFSILLLNMLGALRKWTWLTTDSPPFLVTAGARMLAVAIMALTYVAIDESNYLWFGVGALVCGALGFLAVARFDRLRKVHVLSVPLVDKSGGPLVDRRGKPQNRSVVIGREQDMNETAKGHYESARRERGLSLAQFMSGYGSQKLNDPEALWDRTLLAQVSNRLTLTLMSIVLLAVTTLFLAAFVMETAGQGA
jgi:hypothetical protein